MSLPAVLKVTDVMARYGMRDERTARRMMNEAGGFKVGGRLVIREDALGEFERRQARYNVPAPRPAPPRTVARSISSPSPAAGPDWWRAPRPGDP